MKDQLEQIFIALCETSAELYKVKRQMHKFPSPDKREAQLINSKIDDVLYTMSICNNRIRQRLREKL